LIILIDSKEFKQQLQKQLKNASKKKETNLVLLIITIIKFWNQETLWMVKMKRISSWCSSINKTNNSCNLPRHFTRVGMLSLILLLRAWNHSKTISHHITSIRFYNASKKGDNLLKMVYLSCFSDTQDRITRNQTRLFHVIWRIRMGLCHRLKSL